MAKKIASIKEMKAEITRLEKQIKMAAEQEAIEAIVGSREFSVVREKFAALGTSAQVIGKLFTATPQSASARKSGGGKVPQKYQHPEDSKLLWTGRGRQPKWVQELLATGLSLEDLLIKK